MSQPSATESLAKIAHEYNNVLTVISGSVALAERHAAGNAALIRLLDHVRVAADRAEKLTERLAEIAGAPTRLVLPDPPAKATAAPVPEAPPARTVLVVEDDLNVAAVAMAVLESLGLAVELAKDGPAALARLSELKHVDLVFSDIVMPGGMSGIELAQALESLYPSIPVLLATGFSREALGAGALRFPVLPKPYSVSELSRRVEQIMRGKD
jgi:CheY-like chemotaxis protein